MSTKPNSKILIGLLVLLLLLAACRRQQAQEVSYVSGTSTPTPISTPLPAVATAIPPGAPDNPLQMAVLPAGPVSSARSAVADFESAVQEKSGLTVKVVLVERYAEALAALCDSSAGQVSIAWLNGPTYMAAQAENCGSPILQVQRGSRREAFTGEAGVIITTKSRGLSTLSALNGQDFCRLGYEDFYSWLLPSLVLRANGLSVLSAPATTTDYEDIPTLVKAVADGDCDAAGIPERALDDYADELGEALDKISVLTTTIEFPYAVLMVPPELSLGARTALTDALIEMAKDSDHAVKLRSFLGQQALAAVTADDFTDMVSFMDSTGLDFTQLGN